MFTPLSKIIMMSFMPLLSIFAKECHPIQPLVQENSIHKKKDAKMFEFPALTGFYKVGTTKRPIIDSKRKDPYNASSKRELMLRIWYPAQLERQDGLVRYSEEAIESAKIFNAYLQISEDTKELENIYTHAITDAQRVRGSSFPVILFSHGFVSSVPEMYTAFCEELASHGCIVVAIAHTYYAGSVHFLDGRRITYLPEIAARVQRDIYKEDDLKIWIADAYCALEFLDRFNNDSTDIFYNMFDMKKIGAFGHSFGGVLALRLCLRDARVKAGMSLDGVVFGKGISAQALQKPFKFLVAQGSADLFCVSDEASAKKLGVETEFIRDCRVEFEKMLHSTSSTYLSHVVIPGVQHNAFSDFLILKDLDLYKNSKAMQAMVGAIESKEMLKKINEHIVNFFKKEVF